MSSSKKSNLLSRRLPKASKGFRKAAGNLSISTDKASSSPSPSQAARIRNGLTPTPPSPLTPTTPSSTSSASTTATTATPTTGLSSTPGGSSVASSARPTTPRRLTPLQQGYGSSAVESEGLGGHPLSVKPPTSPKPANTQLDQVIAQQSVDEMRAQRRVFRLATQLPVTKTPNRHASGGANLLPIGRQVATNKTPSPLRNRISTSTATTPTTTKSKPKKTVSSVAPTPSQTSGMSPNRSRANSTNLADSPSQHIGSKKKTKKLTVVLDLDETLVHSTFHGPAGNMYRQTERRKKNVTSNRVQSFRLRLEDGDEVTVNKRPHLKEFLMAMRDEFECHVFTAALPCYARPVLNMIDPKNVIFKKRMYRDSCTPSGMGTFAKDLTRHYKDLSRVVLVDNNPISLMKQPSNGLLVPSFFDDPKDDVLPTVLDFLRQLQSQPDVRPVIRGLQPN